MNAFNIKLILTHNLCIGCGVCRLICPEQCISIEWSVSNSWTPIVDSTKCTDCGSCLRACPNSPKNIESFVKYISKSRESCGLDDMSKNSFYISYDCDMEQRLKSASGGTTIALLKSLLINNKVDCVISVESIMSKIGESHFKAVICRKPEDLEKCRSSAYGPVRYDEVLTELYKSGETCAMTVLPCTQRAVNKLPKLLRKQIRYTIGIMCSHNVTHQFCDFLATKHEIKQYQNFLINYRDKKNIPNANEFNTSFHLSGSAEKIRTPRMTNGFTSMWRNYWFAYECCLYCPDFYVAQADISVKDAWGRLSDDPKGITLCIVRNLEIRAELRAMRKAGWIHLGECGAEEIKNSQNATAVYKQEQFIYRWLQHPLLKEYAKDLPPLPPDKEAVKDYYCKLKTLRKTTSLIQNNSKIEYLILISMLMINKIKTTGKNIYEKIKKKLKRVVSRLIGIIFRFFTFFYSVKNANDKRGMKFFKMGDRGKKGVNVLITGGYGYENVGDEAQLGANIERWRRLLPDCQLMVLSPNPHYTESHHKVDSDWGPRVIWFNANKTPYYFLAGKRFYLMFLIVKWRMLLSIQMFKIGCPLILCSHKEVKLLNQICDADILHISGGGFLTGMTRSRLWENCLLMRLSYLLGTPVILTGQTIGVFKSKRDRVLAKWGLEHAKLICLRDSRDSEKELSAIGINGEHILSYCDDALFCEKAEKKQILSFLDKLGISLDKPIISTVFHYWGQSEEMQQIAKDRFAQLCDHLANKLNAQILFIPMVPSDVNAEKAVIDEMTHKANILSYGFDYRVARGVIALSTLCFTMKHHPIIFAYGEGVPVLSVALDDYYYRKNYGAMAHCKQERFCLNKDSFFSSNSISIATSLINNLDQETYHIDKWVKSLTPLAPLKKAIDII